LNGFGKLTLLQFGPYLLLKVQICFEHKAAFLVVPGCGVAVEVPLRNERVHADRHAQKPGLGLGALDADGLVLKP
jgi:hypothetical protein